MNGPGTFLLPDTAPALQPQNVMWMTSAAVGTVNVALAPRVVPSRSRRPLGPQEATPKGVHTEFPAHLPQATVRRRF